MLARFLGIDLGGSSVKLGVCTADGDVHTRVTIPTEPTRGPDDALRRVGVAARRLIEESGSVEGLGVGVPGELDHARGALVRANNLPGWSDVPFATRMGELLGAPAVLENDANCAAWGEFRAGAGRGARSLALFTLGTGVGGGLVIDGALWTGVSGSAGAFGHIAIDPTGPTCLCGQRGCVEQYASATALARRFGRGSAIDAFAGAVRGEPDALSAVEWTCDALAAGVANVVHVVQPEIVVLAGGMAAAGDLLLDLVRAGVARRVRAGWLSAVRIERSALADNAGWIGAALLAAARARPGEQRAAEALP